MKKFLYFVGIFFIFFVLFSVICFAQKIPEPKIYFDPGYNTFLINLDEQQPLKAILKNNWNISDTYEIELAGNYLDIVNLNIPPISNMNCSSSTQCKLNIGPHQQYPIYFVLFAKKIGDSSLIVHVLSEKSGLSVQKTIKIKVTSDLSRGTFNAPGINWPFLALIGLFGAIIYNRRR